MTQREIEVMTLIHFKYYEYKIFSDLNDFKKGLFGI